MQKDEMEDDIAEAFMDIDLNYNLCKTMRQFFSDQFDPCVLLMEGILKI